MSTEGTISKPLLVTIATDPIRRGLCGDVCGFIESGTFHNPTRCSLFRERLQPALGTPGHHRCANCLRMFSGVVWKPESLNMQSIAKHPRRRNGGNNGAPVRGSVGLHSKTK
jgi:hypothetical protein